MAATSNLSACRPTSSGAGSAFYRPRRGYSNLSMNRFNPAAISRFAVSASVVSRIHALPGYPFGVTADVTFRLVEKE